MNQRLRQIQEWVRGAIHSPRSELDRWESTLRYAYDLGRYGWRQLQQDRAPQMAGALSFRTLFGLLPVLVVSTIILRAIGGFEQFRNRLAEFFRSIGLEELRVVPAAATEDPMVGGAATLSDWLLDLVGQVEELNLAAITWVGVAVVAYAAVSLMALIENSFNTIYRTPTGRGWIRRFLLYWTVLTLLPVAIGVAIYAVNSVDQFIADTLGLGWLRALSVVWSFLATWVVMFGVYKLIPNTTVRFRPALAGAFVAALLIEIGQRTLGAYLQNAVSISQLYGSLGLIPLFMFWVYIMWLVVLFGLEVSATLQMLRGRRLQEVEKTRRPQAGLVDPAMVVTVMELIAEDFEAGQPATVQCISEEAGLSEAVVEPVLERLVEEKLLYRVEEPEDSFTLARPPAQIPAEQLVDIGFDLASPGPSGRSSRFLERLRSAQRQVAAQVNLATLTTIEAGQSAPDQA